MARSTLWILIAFLATAVAAVTGCASVDQDADAQPRLDLRAPVVYGGDNGLEVRSWIVELSPQELAEAFEEIADETPGEITAAVERRWGGEGLRVIRIRLDRLATLSEALSRPATRNTHWLGRTGDWTEIARGAERGSPRGLLVRGEALALPEGEVRLLARAWSTPTLERPRLQVELAIQHLDRRRNDRIQDVFAPARIEPLENEGLLFRDLTLQASLEAGYVYLIAPSPPEEELVDFGTAGPPVERPPSIGHSLLCTSHEIDELRERRRTTIIALIPRAPERLRLLSIVDRAS